MSKNISLSINNHIAIYDKKFQNKSITNPQLALWAKEEFKLNKSPSPSTISKILKKVEQGLLKPTPNKDRKRTRKGKWPVTFIILKQ